MRSTSASNGYLHQCLLNAKAFLFDNRSICHMDGLRIRHLLQIWNLGELTTPNDVNILSLGIEKGGQSTLIITKGGREYCFAI